MHTMALGAQNRVYICPDPPATLLKVDLEIMPRDTRIFSTAIFGNETPFLRLAKPNPSTTPSQAPCKYNTRPASRI
jgi:hypothetical protein